MLLNKGFPQLAQLTFWVLLSSTNKVLDSNSIPQHKICAACVHCYCHAFHWEERVWRGAGAAGGGAACPGAAELRILPAGRPPRRARGRCPGAGEGAAPSRSSAGRPPVRGGSRRPPSQHPRGQDSVGERRRARLWGSEFPAAPAWQTGVRVRPENGHPGRQREVKGEGTLTHRSIYPLTKQRSIPET